MLDAVPRDASPTTPRRAPVTRRLAQWCRRERASAFIALLMGASCAALLVWSLVTGDFKVSEEITLERHVVSR